MARDETKQERQGQHPTLNVERRTPNAEASYFAKATKDRMADKTKDRKDREESLEFHLPRLPILSNCYRRKEDTHQRPKTSLHQDRQFGKIGSFSPADDADGHGFDPFFNRE
jgi:hypothetical protein